VRLTTNQKFKFRQFTSIALAGLVTGFLYPLIEDGWNLFSLINGMLAGFIIGSTVAAFELFVFVGDLRRIQFYQLEKRTAVETDDSLPVLYTVEQFVTGLKDPG
jgi:hypothetical protein